CSCRTEAVCGVEASPSTRQLGLETFDRVPQPSRRLRGGSVVRAGGEIAKLDRRPEDDLPLPAFTPAVGATDRSGDERDAGRERGSGRARLRTALASTAARALRIDRDPGPTCCQCRGRGDASPSPVLVKCGERAEAPDEGAEQPPAEELALSHVPHRPR